MHLAQSLMVKGIVGTVSPIKTGCLNRCALDPVMLVEPGHTMYVGLNKEKIDRIIDEHIISGMVVSEYIVPEAMWGEPIAPALYKPDKSLLTRLCSPMLSFRTVISIFTQFIYNFQYNSIKKIFGIMQHFIK